MGLNWDELGAAGIPFDKVKEIQGTAKMLEELDNKTMCAFLATILTLLSIDVEKLKKEKA